MHNWILITIQGRLSWYQCSHCKEWIGYSDAVEHWNHTVIDLYVCSKRPFFFQDSYVQVLKAKNEYTNK